MKQNSEKRKSKTRDIALIPLFTALISVCAWISVPFANIPFTLQLFAVFLTLLLLGGKRGTLSIAIYIALGAVGVPVFAGFCGGIGVLLGMTGAYIIGFLFGAVAYWIITSLIKKDGGFATFFALFAVLAICYACGSVWFAAMYMKNTGNIGFSAVFMQCVAPYIIPDIIKLILAFTAAKAIKKHIKI